MARIRIDDLPKDKKISQEEMEKVVGGFNFHQEPPVKYGLGNGFILNWPNLPSARQPAIPRRY